MRGSGPKKRRQRILDLLAERPRTVADLAAALRVNLGTVNLSVRHLMAAGRVWRRQRGGPIAIMPTTPGAPLPPGWHWCRCPNCGTIHRKEINWTGRGTPRIFCEPCISTLDMNPAEVSELPPRIMGVACGAEKVSL